jgi:glycosyltransferase involved in cell wall biosynthesis
MHLSNLFSFIAQRESLLLMAKNADIIQTETNFVKDELVSQYGFSPDKIFVCQSGINPKIIDAFSWNGIKIYDACFLARLHKSKGIFDLIDTWQHVCESKKDARLAIAGNGSAEIVNELKTRIKILHLEKNVFYLGFLSEERKYWLYRASKLYVLPSYEEGIPITFYEAMYCCLPVVTYYLPTYSDIKNYVLSVPLGDVAALGDAILRILNDAELLRTFGEKGRGFAEERTWDKVAEALLSNVLKMTISEELISEK